MRLRILTTLTLTIAAAGCAQAAWQKPILAVRKLPAGAAAFEAVKAQPADVAKFYFSKLSQQAGQRGEVRMAYDDDNIYVVFTCLDSGKGKKGGVSPEGEIVPDEDSASVMLDVDNDGRTFCMFTATAAGKKSSEQGRQFMRTDMNADWSLRTTKSGDIWTAFMTIPFKSIGVSAPEAGTQWGAQFSRYDPSIKWPIFWARVRKDPREAQRIGAIVFAGAYRTTASLPDVSVSVPGECKMKVNVHNPSSKPVKLKAQFASDAKIVRMPGAGDIPTQFAHEFTADPGQSTVPVEFSYPFDGWHNLTITITDDRGRVVARSPGIPVRIPPYESRIAHYRGIVDSLQLASASAVSERDQARTMLAELADAAQAAYGDRKKWDGLKTQVDEAEKAVGRLRCLCADAAGVGYAVGTETALTKIMRDKLFEGQFGQPAKIELARNEFESTQVAVIAHDKALEKVSVTVSDLTSDGGVIPSGAVALNLVEFVKTGEPPYEVEYIGWYPDPLMDYQPFDLAKGAIRPVWVTLKCPEDAKAGLYRGTVTIKPANAEETQIPIEVRVWDFGVPTRSHMKTAFAFMDDRYKPWYGSPMSQEQRRQAYQMLLEHRLSPAQIYTRKEPLPSKEDIPFCVEHGLNAICLNYTGGEKNEAGRAEISATIREYEKYLRDNGWWDMAYLYGFDEPPSSKWPALRNQFGWTKEQFPDLPRACTVLPNKQLKGYVNRWIPLVANFDYEESQEYIRDGDEVWWYICCGPEKPFPNWFVDYPAIDPRILFWMNWKYQVPGFLYWTINRWQTNLTSENPEIQKQLDAGKRWPELPWNTKTGASFNGDGHLVYPGPGGKLLSSVRLEAVRDGIDDYEYFYLLNSLVKSMESQSGRMPEWFGQAKKLLAVREDVVKSTFEYTHDPAALYAARREVAEMIERFGR